MDAAPKTLAQLEEEGKEKKYVTLETGSKLSGYTKDYLERLCRLNKIDHRVWNNGQFVLELESLLKETHTILVSYDGISFIDKKELTDPIPQIVGSILSSALETALPPRDQGTRSPGNEKAGVPTIPRFVPGVTPAAQKGGSQAMSYVGRTVTSYPTGGEMDVPVTDSRIPTMAAPQALPTPAPATDEKSARPAVHLSVVRASVPPAESAKPNNAAPPSASDSWDSAILSGETIQPSPSVGATASPLRPISTSVDATAHHDPAPLFPPLQKHNIEHSGFTVKLEPLRENFPTPAPAPTPVLVPVTIERAAPISAPASGAGISPKVPISVPAMPPSEVHTPIKAIEPPQSPTPITPDVVLQVPPKAPEVTPPAVVPPSAPPAPTLPRLSPSDPPIASFPPSMNSVFSREEKVTPRVPLRPTAAALSAAPISAEAVGEIERRAPLPVESHPIMNNIPGAVLGVMVVVASLAVFGATTGDKIARAILPALPGSSQLQAGVGGAFEGDETSGGDPEVIEVAPPVTQRTLHDLFSDEVEVTATEASERATVQPIFRSGEGGAKEYFFSSDHETVAEWTDE